MGRATVHRLQLLARAFLKGVLQIKLVYQVTDRGHRNLMTIPIEL